MEWSRERGVENNKEKEWSRVGRGEWSGVGRGEWRTARRRNGVE